MERGSEIRSDEINILREILNRLLQYYRLFICLFIAGIAGFFLFIYFIPAKYNISASVLIKDEKKGADDSKILESLSIYTSNKIVENEIEVIHSRTLMSEVVENLGLYAPVYRKDKFRSLAAYQASPVNIRVKNLEELEEQDFADEIFFTYSPVNNNVTMNGQSYPLNTWVNTAYGTLRFTRNHLAKKISNYLFYFTLLSPKKLSNALLANLEVAAANRLSTVVSLNYKDEVPKRGEAILNELIKVYNHASINQKTAFAANTLAFVDARLKYVGGELASVEKQVQQYKATKGVVNLSEQGSVYLQNVGETDQKLANIKLQTDILNEVEQFVNSSGSSSGIIPSTLGVQDPVLSNLLQKLYDAEMNYNRLRKTVAENNPMVTSLQNEIENIRPTILANIRVQKIGLNTSKNNLTSTGQKYSSILEGIPQKERGLLEINRQQAVLSNVYAFLLQKREETELAYSSTVADSRIVDLAQSSNKPVSPKKILVLLASMGFFMGSGVIFVFIIGFLNQKLTTRSQIEALTSIPVISEILHVKEGTDVLIDKEKNIVVYHQFKQLRTALGFFKKEGCHKLLISSSVSGEGKSFISANLAVTTAASGKRTLLMDCDFRNPQISKTFEIHNKPGIIEYLGGGVDSYEIIKASKFEGLFIMGAGKLLSEEGTELISNGKLHQLFAYLSEIFDVIIIDAPPVQPVSDAYILSQYSDDSLFIVRHRYTPKAILSSLDKNNKSKDLKISSIVYNDVTKESFVNDLYGYGYNYKYLRRQYNKEA